MGKLRISIWSLIRRNGSHSFIIIDECHSAYKSLNIGSYVRKNASRSAILAILTAVSVIALGDALAKLLSADYSLWQIFTLRSLICLIAILVIARCVRFQGLLRVKRLRWLLLRNVLIVSQVVLYYIALPKVLLSVAAAAIYTMPLIATLIAIFFLAEKGGLRIWVGVLLGYVGVLFIVQPQHDQFNYFVLLPLGAAVLAALANLVTKFKCADEHPVTISFNLNLLLLGVGAVATTLGWIWSPVESSGDTVKFLLRNWEAMNISELGTIVVMAIAFGIGSTATAMAYQIGPVARIATLDFCYIAFAVLWGAVLFGELPTSTTVFGIVFICISGVLVTRVQNRRD